MHRLVKLGFAAALLAGVASPVLAEGTKLNTAASTTTSTTADPTTTGSVNLSMDSILMDISSTTGVNLSGFTSTSTIQFVPVDTLQGWNATKFDAEIGKKTADLTSLRSKIEANAALKSKIEAAGHEVDDVIAIDEESGSFKVYVDDRA
jgi:hypothetical protein